MIAFYVLRGGGVGVGVGGKVSKKMNDVKPLSYLPLEVKCFDVSPKCCNTCTFHFLGSYIFTKISLYPKIFWKLFLEKYFLVRYTRLVPM
jgi:hypothetical protein